MLRTDFQEQISNLDAERLCVGDAVVLRLGPSLGPSKSENGMVVRVHGGEDERVDVAMHDTDVNGTVQLYTHVSRRKISRPQYNFCDDPRWIEAAAEVTGFESSEVPFHFISLIVSRKSLFYFILVIMTSTLEIPERLKRMEHSLKNMKFEKEGRTFPAYLDHADGKPPVIFPLCPVMWK